MHAYIDWCVVGFLMGWLAGGLVGFCEHSNGSVTPLLAITKDGWPHWRCSDGSLEEVQA